MDVTFVFLADEESIPLLGEPVPAGLSKSPTPPPDLALDPGTAIILTGAVILAARFVVSLWERWRGGVRIDLGTEPPTIERLREVPYGVVVVLTVDDDVRIETVDEPEEVVERILSKIFSLGSAPAPADVTAAVAQGRAAAG